MPSKNRILNLNTKGKDTPSIVKYLNDLKEYSEYPGRIVNGVMLVLFHGHWVSQDEFNSVIKPPTVIAAFYSKKDNPDGTMNWINK